MAQNPSPSPKPAESPTRAPELERQTKPNEETGKRDERKTLPDVTEGTNESGDPMPFEPTD